MNSRTLYTFLRCTVLVMSRESFRRRLPLLASPTLVPHLPPLASVWRRMRSSVSRAHSTCPHFRTPSSRRKSGRTTERRLSHESQRLPLVSVRGVRSSGNRRPTVLPLACASRVAAKSGRRPLTLRCSLGREPSLNRTSTIRESLRLRSLNLPMVRCARLVLVKCSLVVSFTTMTRSMRTASHGRLSAQRSVTRFGMSCTVRRSASSADLAVEASRGWTS